MDQSTRWVGRYDGLAPILVGVGLILIAAVRFFRIAKMTDDPKPHMASGTRFELAVSVILALLTAALCIYLVLT